MSYERKANPYIENLIKFVGRDVNVLAFKSSAKGKDGEVWVRGKCEQFDFSRGAVIIQTDIETICVPKFLLIKRARKHPEIKTKKDEGDDD